MTPLHSSSTQFTRCQTEFSSFVHRTHTYTHRDTHSFWHSISISIALALFCLIINIVVVEFSIQHPSHRDREEKEFDAFPQNLTFDIAHFCSTQIIIAFPLYFFLFNYCCCCCAFFFFGDCPPKHFTLCLQRVGISDEIVVS